eukprot:scaffold3437_cov31-Tisochrysis_lutea.AAC.6
MPVYITSTRAEPDARTVFDQSVFSSASGSTVEPPSTASSCNMSRDGGAMYTVALARESASSDGSFWHAGTASRSFQSVSPSS